MKKLLLVALATLGFGIELLASCGCGIIRRTPTTTTRPGFTRIIPR